MLMHEMTFYSKMLWIEIITLRRKEKWEKRHVVNLKTNDVNGILTIHAMFFLFRLILFLFWMFLMLNLFTKCKKQKKTSKRMKMQITLVSKIFKESGFRINNCVFHLFCMLLMYVFLLKYVLTYCNTRKF